MKKWYKYMTKHWLNRELIELHRDLDNHKLSLEEVQLIKKKIKAIREVVSDRVVKTLIGNK